MSDVEYKDDKIKFYVQEDILFCEFLTEIGDYSLVDFGIKKRLELYGETPRLMISDIRAIKKSTREGRQRMADADAAKGVIAVGVLLNSKVHQVMYNFFNAIYKQPAPAKVFTNKEDAVKWIKQFLPKDDKQ